MVWVLSFLEIYLIWNQYSLLICSWILLNDAVFPCWRFFSSPFIFSLFFPPWHPFSPFWALELCWIAVASKSGRGDWLSVFFPSSQTPGPRDCAWRGFFLACSLIYLSSRCSAETCLYKIIRSADITIRLFKSHNLGEDLKRSRREVQILLRFYHNFQSIIHNLNPPGFYRFVI